MRNAWKSEITAAKPRTIFVTEQCSPQRIVAPNSSASTASANDEVVRLMCMRRVLRAPRD
jgi:hypothetical protein